MSSLGDTLRSRIQWKGPVRSSPDLTRILALPRRDPTPSYPPEFEESLKRPGCSMQLKPLQGMALHELKVHRRLVGALPVGSGKTGVALLAPTVLGAKVSVLLVPSQLKAQILERDYPLWAKHWKVPSLPDVLQPGCDSILYVIAYETLSSPKNFDILDRIQPRPSLWICDEAHKCSQRTSARAKRLFRALKAADDSVYVPLSGTFIDRSILDARPHFNRALGQSSPYPHDYMVAQSWSEALDPDPNGWPVPPGELEQLGLPVRDAFRKRLVETPGVVATSAPRLGTTLVIDRREFPVPHVGALEQLRKTWCTPGGEELREALELSRYARQMALGFYYRWIWPNGESQAIRDEWMQARKEWHREIRTFLSSRAKPGLDSPKLLAMNHEKWGSETWPRWDAIRHQAKPQTEAVWLDKSAVQVTADWGKENVGIIWYEHDAFAKELAEHFPIYGGGEEASASIIKEKGDRTIVASVKAHGTGKNLQMFSRALVTTPSSNNKTWEQLLGRLHREGQKADEVQYDVYLHTPELVEAFHKARELAKFHQSIPGGEQRLLYANYTFNPEEV